MDNAPPSSTDGLLGEGVPLPRRRGRPYKLPEDPTPIPAPVPGLNQRMAWLLGSSRIHSGDARLTRRETFIGELQELDVVADTTRLSRWESGRAAVPARVLGAYEQILGLRRGQLVVARSGMVNGIDPSPARPDPLENEPAQAHALLDELFEVVLAGNAPGHVWMDLCDVLTRQRHLYLLPDTWTQVSDLLADELGRSTGLAYVARFESLRMLIRHATSRRHAVRALGALVTNPATEFVIHPLSLLQEVQDRQASDVLMRLLIDGPGQLRVGAAWAVAGKLARNHFDADEISRLESTGLAMLRGNRNPMQRIDALGIHAAMPTEAHERLALAGLDQDDRLALELCRRHGELARPDDARGVSERLAGRVQESTSSHTSVDADLMLCRLIREALFHVHHERRHQAALLLAASPYRASLADQLLMLAVRSEEAAAVLALTALYQVADAGQRPTLMQLAVAEERPQVRVAALLALGQVVGELAPAEADQLRAAMPDEGQLTQATVHVLGMGGAAARLENGSPTDELAVAARWWRRKSAIIEQNARS